ncbi:MAG: BamA/TamA family outer membrane protein [Synechococcus sp.]|nr:BamA/TamA family outer membrane protein [Synechococcus sp.]
MLRPVMAKGLTHTANATLLRSLVVGALAAPFLALAAGAQVRAQEPEAEAVPTSEQVSAPAADAAVGSSEPQVLISEVVVEGVADHPDRERLERAVYDALTVRPGTTTNRAALKADLDAIYATGWFSDVRVQPSDSPLGVRLVVTVDPNPVLTEVVLNNPKALLPKAEITEVFASDYGRTLNLKTLERRVRQLQKWYSAEGYSLARITGPTRVSPDGVVELSVREGIVEGIKIEYLNANGDSTNDKGEPIRGKTKPWVVDREISLRPGELFNRRQLEGDIKRLYATGLFSDVKVTLKPIPAKPGEVTIVLGVVEQSTGSLSGGIGYSQNQGLFGQVQLNESNLFGNAWDTGINITYGQYGALADASFNIPWIKGDMNRSGLRFKAFLSREIPQTFQSVNNGSIRTLYDFYQPSARSESESAAVNRALGYPSRYVVNVDDIGANNIRQAKNAEIAYVNGKVLKGSDFYLYNPEGDLVRVQRVGGNAQYIRPLRGGDPYKKNLWTLVFGLSGQEAVTMNGLGEARAYGAAPFRNLGKRNPVTRQWAATPESIICLAYNCANSNQLVGGRVAVSYNALNDNKNPRSGTFFTVGSEQYVSVGENSPTFNRQRFSATHFIPVNFINFYKGCRPKKGEAEDCPQAIAFQFTAGNVTGQLPPYEAFCLGGNNSVRGFSDCDLGVGRSYVEATIEYRFPIFKIISGEVFVDAGSALGSQNAVPGRPGELLLKPGQGFSVGTGVILTTPVGPLRLEVASRDWTGEYRFNVGVGFKF